MTAMRRRNKRKHSYTILLAVSILAAAGMWKTGILEEIQRADDLRDGVYASVAEEIDTGEQTEIEASAEAVSAPAAEQEAQPEVREPIEAAESEPEEPAEEPEPAGPVMETADASYFDDALFIGDSRTVGLHEYGDLGGAEVFADSGMSVYKILKEEFKLSTGEKGSLEELLSGRQFGKIYIMLGINELGYDFDATAAKYKALIERIQELQPGAILFLEANLHITSGKSEGAPIYNNENINRFNQAVSELADNETRFYLDVNELFDDENGGLAEEYTVDEAHVLGIYYADWVNWILEHAVVK